MNEYESLSDRDLRDCVEKAWARARGSPEMSIWGVLYLEHPPYTSETRDKLTSALRERDFETVTVGTLSSIRSSLPSGFKARLYVDLGDRSLSRIVPLLRASEEGAGGMGPYDASARWRRFILHCMLSSLGVAPRWRGLEIPGRPVRGDRNKTILFDNWLIDLQWLCRRRDHQWLKRSALAELEGANRNWKKMLNQPFDLGEAEALATRHMKRVRPRERFFCPIPVIWECATIQLKSKGDAKAFDRYCRKLVAKEGRVREQIAETLPSPLEQEDLDARLAWWRALSIASGGVTEASRLYRLRTGKSATPQAADYMKRRLRSVTTAMPFYPPSVGPFFPLPMSPFGVLHGEYQKPPGPWTRSRNNQESKSLI